MSKYYAYISDSANIVTNFNPYSAYYGNDKNIRIEYVGNITTTATSNVYVWRQSSGSGWFSFEQGSFQQYMNIASTTYVTDVNNTAANRRSFNSDDPDNPAVFVLNNGSANLTFNNWTTTGTFSGILPDVSITFFKTMSAGSLKMNFYEFKVYNANNSLLFDFVPDYDGTTKGLRDKVSGNFFSATTQSAMTLYQLSTFETDITAITATYETTTSSVTLTADEDMAWTASTLNDWITLSTTGGTGSSVFTVTLSKNKVYSARNGLVTLTNGEDVIEITVEQAKYPLLIPNENIYKADLEVIKAYRSGSTINKAYRSGELILWRRNPTTE